MANKKERAGLFPALAGTLGLYLISGTVFLLYLASKYQLFLLASTALALPALMMTVTFILRKDRTLKPFERGEKSEKIFLRVLFATGRFFAHIGRFFAAAYIRYRAVLKFLVTAAVVIASATLVFISLSVKAAATVAIWQPIVTAVLIVIAVIIDKWCLHTETESAFYKAELKNIRAFLPPTYLILAVVTITSVVTALGLYDASLYVKYLLLAVFFYTLVFVIISIATSMIRKEFDSAPRIVIPIPFVKGGADDLSVIDYLEENTGITMRGLWSMRYIKQIAPITVVLVVGFLWLSTCIVQIDSTSHAAVYRLGKLSDTVLDPGIHFVLPFPFDKVEIYNTEAVQRTTIGYDSTENTDNLWTNTHGKNEYKLLLGSGDELVSINLRLEYKITDLHAYLTTTASPETMLRAQAYELVTDETIDSDLATLLSADRDALSEHFHKELDKKLDKYDLGIDIVSVVLESIHPPLDIATTYQEIISAEIEAEQKIIMAQSSAAVLLADAEEFRDTSIGTATAEHYSKVAAAQTEVAEFMAGVEAYNAYPNAYKYHKYLKAITEAYKKAKVVIVGNGVDGSRLYFGNLTPQAVE